MMISLVQTTIYEFLLKVEEPVDLVINVFDANDNVPVFDKDSLVGNVPENHAICEFK